MAVSWNNVTEENNSRKEIEAREVGSPPERARERESEHNHIIQ